MPPTFFVFLLVYLAATVYIYLLAAILLVFVPLLLFSSTRALAKKVLVTALLPSPCLIIMGLVCTIIFFIPLLIFTLASNYLPPISASILGITGMFMFCASVAGSSLYLWYFLSKTLHLRIDGASVANFFEENRPFQFVKPLLIKIRLYPYIEDYLIYYGPEIYNDEEDRIEEL